MHSSRLNTLRSRLAARLLRPELRAELAFLHAQQQDCIENKTTNGYLTPSEQERYWQGRVTSIRKVMEAGR